MELTIKMNVTRETMENIFITALEGGSNDWYFLNDKAIDIVEETVPRGINKSLAERVFESVYDKGAIIHVCDVEDHKGEPIGELNRETFQERIDYCVENFSWAIMSEINETGDALSSDVVFQCLCLGEVIYG